MLLPLTSFICGMALEASVRGPVPGDGGIWDVRGAWCSTRWEHPSQKSQPDQLYKTDQGEYGSGCHGYQSL